MNTQFQIQVEHLYVVDGMLERLPHNQTAVPVPQEHHRQHGALFVVAEVQGRLNNTDLIEKRLTMLVRDSYYGSAGGITAGLRRAMDTANQWLFQHNATHPPEKRVIAGIVAAVLHNDDLFVSQAGPAAIFTRVEGFITRYPEYSTWLQPVSNPLVGPSPAVGWQHTIDPYIAHVQVQAGDVIALVDGRLGKSLPTEKASQILADDDIKQISQKLVKNTQLQYGSAMVIQLEPSAANQSVSIPKKSRQPATAAPVSRQKGGFHFAIPAAVSATIHPTHRQSVAAATMPRQRLSLSLPKLPALPPLPKIHIPVADIWRTVATAVVGATSFLGNGLQTMLRLILPSATVDNNAPRSARRASRSSLKTVAIVLPLVAIAVALVTYVYQGYHRTQQYASTLIQANEKFNAALGAPTDQARGLLNDAVVLTDQAAALKIEQPETTALKEKIITEQDTINNVKYLYYVPALKEYDTAAQPKQVIRQGMNLYVFDAGSGQIYHHTLDAISDGLLPDESIIAQTGQQAGDVAIGKILGMTWIPAAGNHQVSDLVIATRTGLFEYDPALDVLAPSNIYSPDQWQNPVAFGSYYGNFYVLDAGANQIFRYLPAETGYPTPPEQYFADGIPVNLNDAVDMTIDGAIYVLYHDGHIARFLSGEPVPFEVSGLDVPLKDPTAIFTPSEDAPMLYVADAGNRRIVQLSKEGKFIAQFKPKTADDDITFDNLHDIFVNAEDGKMYTLSGSTLYAPSVSEN